ncbi:MAG: response regulator [Planctomycetia bacterium]|nr:response regulator [Planctomycetia bacterium]
MKILIAEDDPISRCLLEASLAKWQYEVVVATDGAQAWQKLQADDPPELAILDWMMPELDGPTVCRQLRALKPREATYVILLTARTEKADIVAGLEAGADDYLTKPFNRDELKARLGVGVRLVGLQRDLAERVRQLEEALAQVKQLSGLLPICAWCKKVRNDQNFWLQVEDYLASHGDLRFTHAVCPECLAQMAAKLKAEKGG